MGGSLSALVLSNLGPSGSVGMPLLMALGVHGFFVNAVQSSMFVLAAHVYTTKVRATGISSAYAVGRVGSVLIALAGARLVQGGQTVYFSFIALAMVGTLIGLALVRNHMPARR